MTDEQEKLYWGVVRILEDGERLPLISTLYVFRPRAVTVLKQCQITTPYRHELARFRAVHGEDSVKFEEVEADD